MTKRTVPAWLTVLIWIVPLMVFTATLLAVLSRWPDVPPVPAGFVAGILSGLVSIAIHADVENS